MEIKLHSLNDAGDPYVAIVDDVDYARLIGLGNWHVLKCPRNIYAYCNIRREGKRSKLLLHRAVMQLDAADTRDVDHRNHNGLDCQKHNLRACTRTQNQYNRRKSETSQFPYKGLSFDKRKRSQKHPWQASIRYLGKGRYLGRFATPEEAAERYNLFAWLLHGEFGYHERRTLVTSETDAA